MSLQRHRRHWSTLRKWTLATIAYCQVCRMRTAQHDLHEFKAEQNLEIIITECAKCGNQTGVQRFPRDPGRPMRLTLDDV